MPCPTSNASDVALAFPLASLMDLLFLLLFVSMGGRSALRDWDCSVYNVQFEKLISCLLWQMNGMESVRERAS